MPRYKTHEAVNMVIGMLLLIGAVMYDLDPIYSVIGYIAFMFATYYMSPDLDIICKSYFRWGILRFYWLPYRWIMKHRGSSHSIIWGPISLIIYISLPLIPFIDRINMVHTLPIIAGIILATESHILLDKIR